MNYKVYLKLIQKRFKHTAVWPTGIPVMNGDIGYIANGREYTQFTTLGDLGIDVSQLIRVDSMPDDQEDYVSSRGVKITFNVAGEAKPAGSSLQLADAGFTIEFSQGDQLVFQGKNGTWDAFRNLIPIAKRLLAKYPGISPREVARRIGSGPHGEDIVVVTSVGMFESATILYSSSSDAKLDLRCNANVKQGEADLASADIGLAIMRQSSMSITIVAQNKTTPFFEVWKVSDIVQIPDLFIGNRISGYTPESDTSENLAIGPQTTEEIYDMA